MQRHSLLTLVLCLALLLGAGSMAGAEHHDADLVVIDAAVLDVRTGLVRDGMTITIRDGWIVSLDTGDGAVAGDVDVFDAAGRLVVPGLVDAHNHLNFLFGDAPDLSDLSQAEAFRARLAEAYLPYGVTSVRSAGGLERNLATIQLWGRHRPDAPDYYPSGGAIVSLDTEFYNHAFVESPEAAAAKVAAFAARGIRHIKVYSLIDAATLAAVLGAATEHELRVFGHIEQAMIGIGESIDLGLVDFEHAKTFFLDALATAVAAGDDFSGLPPDDNETWRFREYEIFIALGSDHAELRALANRLAALNGAVTPTLHLYAHPIGETHLQVQTETGEAGRYDWSAERTQRAREGYAELAGFVRGLHEAGVRLQTGSDTDQPGLVILSEMLLLHALGIPMTDVFTIATLNGAAALGLEHEIGAVEAGYRANLVLFDANPRDDPPALLGGRTVIKDGVVFRRPD